MAKDWVEVKTCKCGHNSTHGDYGCHYYDLHTDRYCDCNKYEDPGPPQYFKLDPARSEAYLIGVLDDAGVPNSGYVAHRAYENGGSPNSQRIYLLTRMSDFRRDAAEASRAADAIERVLKQFYPEPPAEVDAPVDAAAAAS